jgi:two-component system response regulator
MNGRGIVVRVQGTARKISSTLESPAQEGLATSEVSGGHFLPFEPEESSSQGGTGGSRRLALVVEDNRADVFLVERAVELHRVPVRVTVVDDGEQALKYLALAEGGQAPCPALILLDLNLPKRSGAEVLRHWRSSSRCRGVPVIVFTSSDSAEDRGTAAELGVNRYFRKPMTYDEFLKIGEVMNEILAGEGGAEQ